MKEYRRNGGVDPFILNVDPGQRAALPPEKNPDAHWRGSCVGSRVDLDDLDKNKALTLTGIRTPDRPTSIRIR